MGRQHGAWSNPRALPTTGSTPKPSAWGFLVAGASLRACAGRRSPRAWLGAGVLDAVPGSRPVKISTGRLAEAVSLVERLRRAGRDRDLLTAMVDRFEDESVASQPRVRRSLTALRDGRLQALSAEEPGSYDMFVAALVKSIEELQELVDKCAHPRTGDDVSITSDGRRLDTKEKVLAFLEELDVERAAHAPQR